MDTKCKNPWINPENTTSRNILVVQGLTFGTESSMKCTIVDSPLDTLYVYMGVHYWKWASKRRLDTLLANTLAPSNSKDSHNLPGPHAKFEVDIFAC